MWRIIFLVFVLMLFFVSIVHAAELGQNISDPALAARSHYVAGESALKSGDILTAIIEWETVLKLKPTSDYTQKRLTEVLTKQTPEVKEAHDRYLTGILLKDQGKLDQAQKELVAALNLQPEAKCVKDQLIEIADREAKERTKTLVNDLNTIVIHGNSTGKTSPQKPSISIDKANSIRLVRPYSSSSLTRPSKDYSPLRILAIDWTPTGEKKYGQLGYVIQGQLRNESSNRFDYVSLTISIYGPPAGHKIDSEVINTEGLAPGKTWDFRGLISIWSDPLPAGNVRKEFQFEVDEIYASRSVIQSPGTAVIVR